MSNQRLGIILLALAICVAGSNLPTSLFAVVVILAVLGAFLVDG